ncbi:CRISPR-associated protein Cas4 [Persephonella atlantica]|uniref:CRISPR-associated exonuclease Cas4 n=1 Tax=Persephonella atlantica TaxID=2699429 RepID=A0ABS1GGM3_9AQUI|nr:CRISPR-associated protein Cas4 [Persephonella atlantica]MBK3331971.1 CRISPR-associated protein Cas4 [Persephonella atlantica]
MNKLENINGTLIWYYYICPREVWLIGHGIEADQESDFLILGKHIQEIFYKRQKKGFLIDNTIQIDILPNKKIIGEIKKSSKFLESARMQVAFYIYYMKQKGINLEGELLIPEERKREKIVLTKELEQKLEEAVKGIQKILKQETPPEPVKIPYCRNCAYKEMCWS